MAFLHLNIIKQPRNSVDHQLPCFEVEFKNHPRSVRYMEFLSLIFHFVNKVGPGLKPPDHNPKIFPVLITTPPSRQPM